MPMNFDRLEIRVLNVIAPIPVDRRLSRNFPNDIAVGSVLGLVHHFPPNELSRRGILACDALILASSGINRGLGIEGDPKPSDNETNLEDEIITSLLKDLGSQWAGRTDGLFPIKARKYHVQRQRDLRQLVLMQMKSGAKV